MGNTNVGEGLPWATWGRKTSGHRIRRDDESHSNAAFIPKANGGAISAEVTPSQSSLFRLPHVCGVGFYLDFFFAALHREARDSGITRKTRDMRIKKWYSDPVRGIHGHDTASLFQRFHVASCRCTALVCASFDRWRSRGRSRLLVARRALPVGVSVGSRKIHRHLSMKRTT